MTRDKPYSRARKDWLLPVYLAPPASRLPMLAALALHEELERIGHRPGEPLIALIRYRWWREALEAHREKKTPIPHEIFSQLKPGLSHASLEEWLALIEAHERVVEGGEAAEATAALFTLWSKFLGSAVRPPDIHALAKGWERMRHRLEAVVPHKIILPQAQAADRPFRAILFVLGRYNVSQGKNLGKENEAWNRARLAMALLWADLTGKL